MNRNLAVLIVAALVQAAAGCEKPAKSPPGGTFAHAGDWAGWTCGGPGQPVQNVAGAKRPFE